jgi:hypothetical protein
MSAIEYLDKVIAECDRNNTEWTVVDVMEQFAKLMVIDELERLETKMELHILCGNFEILVIEKVDFLDKIKDLKQE